MANQEANPDIHVYWSSEAVWNDPARLVAAGGDHSLAVMIEGTVKAWGDNDNGQIGIGSKAKMISRPSLSCMPSGIRNRARGAARLSSLPRAWATSS